uniref:Uncharacterized protein n=1 Tax=Rhizophora mucronata TaxID=61149 RepID=A0A2P2Q7M2_RHIMU
MPLRDMVLIDSANSERETNRSHINVDYLTGTELMIQPDVKKMNLYQ